MPIRDVQRQHSSVGKLLEIQINRLPRNQVHWYRIRAESIEDDDAISLRVSFQRLSGITDLDPAGLAAIAQVRKVLPPPGDPLNGRVDLEKGPEFTGLTVSGDRTHAQTNHRDPPVRGYRNTLEEIT